MLLSFAYLAFSAVLRLLVRTPAQRGRQRRRAARVATSTRRARTARKAPRAAGPTRERSAPCVRPTVIADTIWRELTTKNCSASHAFTSITTIRRRSLRTSRSASGCSPVPTRFRRREGCQNSDSGLNLFRHRANRDLVRHVQVKRPRTSASARRARANTGWLLLHRWPQQHHLQLKATQSVRTAGEAANLPGRAPALVAGRRVGADVVLTFCDA